jgi:hypothetical protein
VGIQYQPRAKMVSLCVVFVLLFVYNKLIDMSAHRVASRCAAACVLPHVRAPRVAALSARRPRAGTKSTCSSTSSP